MDELISKKAVLDIAFKYCPDDDGVCSEAGGDLRNMLDEIENLPPAEPKRIRGKWNRHEHGYWTFVNADGERDGWIPDYECDQCGSRGWKEVAPMNFCPNCGAKMDEVTT